MRKFNAIVSSEVEPSVNDLWLNDGTLKYFGKNGWTSLIKIPERLTLPEEEVIPTFSVSNSPEDKRTNRLLAADILFDKVEAVRIKGIQNDVTYNTIGIYHDGYITAIQKNDFVVFNVSFEDGSITVETKVNVGKTLPYVELKVGDTNEIMQYNIEHLPNGEFFMHIEYGYGVGTFHDGIGGFAHITNAYGNELFYKINIDGSIMPDRDYIKPNQPYTLKINQSLIGTKLEDVVSSALKKAGELVVKSTSGPISYTRNTDSNENMVYFTDEDMNGQITRITYNNTNKMLTAVKVPMKKVSAVEVGGISQGKAIADADSTTLLNKFNELLAELRKSGVIAE